MEEHEEEPERGVQVAPVLTQLRRAVVLPLNTPPHVSELLLLYPDLLL